MSQLSVHHSRVSDRSIENRLIKHYRKFKRRIADQQLLADHSDLHTGIDDSWRNGYDSLVTKMHLTGIIFGLQETRYDVNRPDCSRGRFRLKAYKGLVLLWECVRVVLPPASLICFPGKGQQLASLGVRDSIKVEHLLHFIEGKGAAAKLVSADLRS